MESGSAIGICSGMVSCICPTYNRRPWMARSIRCFLGQDFAERELLILDDGTDPVADLVPADRRIRYHRLSRRLPIGTKRNLACELARGEFIAHWDDDDWYPAWRLSRQIAALMAAGADICGTSQLYYCDVDAQRAFQYSYGNAQPWVAGNTFLYRRSLWQRARFLDVQLGEDSRFLARASAPKVLDLKEPRLCIAALHRGNTSPKSFSSSWWKAVGTLNVQQLMVECQETEHPAVPSQGHCALHCGFHIARKDDLGMIEFAAFNAGQNLPAMRRCELPWALFAAGLENTSAVLDCTINPAGLGELLGQLYPHVHYTHLSPLQNGCFQLPLGIPDNGFDRIFCINTLEHLLGQQREELLAELARKLKAGGLLVLTSDYYFDSSWKDPVFLSAGVMRADEREFVGGWNKIRWDDWLRPLRANGLNPVNAGETHDLAEDDGSCYLNPEPFPHATIAGVFSKGARAPARPLHVVLALLTWNTRNVSLDSLHAYIREAQMLTRLGCEPYICVCDNGSTDGTQALLREMDANLEVPHRFILNAENLGNSVARNQIIDFFLACGGDYLMFMDGDIEIVPFSSFAMLRHMENCGYRLGCVGADFRQQSPLRAQASPCLYCIDPQRLQEGNWVAWTQYGMFRRAVFESGVRFDESGPFQGPGWGFEDNDLAFQLEMNGFRIQCFSGMTYLHRAARSSVRMMRQLGQDPQATYEKRKQYVVAKWASVPQINSGPLTLVRRVQMQL